MSQMEVRNVNNSMDFSQVSKKEKKELVEKIMLKKINYMKKISIDEIIRHLSDVMTGGEHYRCNY